MRLKYYLRGAGIGVVVTTVILAIVFAMNPKAVSDDEIVQRARQLGMVDATEADSNADATGSIRDSITDKTGDTGFDDTTTDETSAGDTSAVDTDVADATDNNALDVTDPTDADADDSAGNAKKTDAADSSGVTEEKTGSDVSDKTEKTDKSDTTGKTDKTEKNEKKDKSDKTGKTEKTEKSDNNKTEEKADTTEKNDTTDNSKTIDASVTNEKTETSEKTETAGNTDQAATQNGNTRTIKITNGNVSSTVAGYLYKAGLVDSASDFDNYIQNVKKDRIIMCGTFEIPVGASYDEIINIITKERN